MEPAGGGEVAWVMEARTSRLANRDSADWMAASIASFDSASVLRVEL